MNRQLAEQFLMSYQEILSSRLNSTNIYQQTRFEIVQSFSKRKFMQKKLSADGNEPPHSMSNPANPQHKLGKSFPLT